MKNRKYIPKLAYKVISDMNCGYCIHKNKCISTYRVESKFCLSFSKRAGIR